ncbi:MAG: aspartate carbamoyltransferase [Clostridiales bacterium]|nr:aspartate carbamoyltransferase [Clostridiales bacterium]
MKHFITAEGITRGELERLYSVADDIKRNKAKYRTALSGYIIATLFYEPSTRTRLSFESSIQRLGANVISTENARENASAKKGESLEDTVRIVQGYSDMIIIRHFEVDSAERAVKVAKVPIINAGSGGGEHPTQGLLDIYTIREYRGKVDGTSIAVMGDLKYGRTVHSMLKLISLYDGVTVYGFPVKGLELPEFYKDFLAAKKVKYIECKTFTDIPKDVNFIYQTRVQTERLEDPDIKIEEMILNKANFARFSDNTYLLHPLPRVDEISPDLDDDKRCVYFNQAHNGIPTRMALIYTLFRDFYNIDLK